MLFRSLDKEADRPDGVIVAGDRVGDVGGVTVGVDDGDDAIRAISLFVEIIANAVVDADNEVGIQIIETLGDEDEGESAAEAKDEDEKIVFSTDEETDYSTFEAVEEKVEENGEEEDILDEETLFKD